MDLATWIQLILLSHSDEDVLDEIETMWEDEDLIENTLNPEQQ